MIRVDYNGLIADIREEDLKECIESLSLESDESRKQIMQSVQEALEYVLSLVEKGETPSPKLLQDTANDIGIWFANETIEGRTERYAAKVQ